MKIYERRIGFLVSYQTLIPHGGIGQYAKSFIELMRGNNIKVDIITDKEPRKSDFTSELNTNIIYPDVSLPYTEHSATFMHDDTFCYERMANFRNAIIKAHRTNIYDAFICNTYETVQVASTMQLEESIQIIAYTHLESQLVNENRNPFLVSTNNMMRLQLLMPNIYIGTQSEYNTSLIKNSYQLPIPLSEPSLLDEHHVQRDGVLYIGRWEYDKHPEVFINIIKQTKLPAKVLTSPNGVHKFEEALSTLGVQYEVKGGLFGEEKVKFITSSRVAVNPSYVESYGMAFYETHIQLPTVALSDKRWTNNFDNRYFYQSTRKNIAETVSELYEQYPTAESFYQGRLEYFRQQENKVFDNYKKCFSSFKSKESDKSTASILQLSTFSVKEYVEKLNRKILSMDDILPMYTNKHMFNVKYTDTNTYFSTDTDFLPEEESGLFAWS